MARTCKKKMGIEVDKQRKKSDDVENTRLYMLRRCAEAPYFYARQTDSTDADNGTSARLKEHGRITSVLMDIEQGCQISMKETPIAAIFADGAPVYTKGTFNRETSLAIEYCINYVNPQFGNAGTERTSRFMRLADEETVERLGTLLPSIVFKDRAVIKIERESYQSNISNDDKSGKHKCPKGCKLRANVFRMLADHCRRQGCSQIKDKDKKLSDEELMKSVMDKLKKASARRTAGRKHSVYVLLTQKLLMILRNI
uniref:Helitron_like_N domain-containing protein n=1 Tax=Rhabditophanes sp. KR3021 TaxID=114890 RepID=A0AC35UHW4_9BILA